jgi:hypothetical protein
MLENASDSSSLVGRPFARRSRKQRSKITNRPTKMVIDGRSQIGRRLRDLADQFADGLGGWQQLSELRATAVRKAAELVAIAEGLRADRLRGLPVSPDDIVRTDRLAHLAVRQLGLDHKREPVGPDLRAQFRAAYGLHAREEVKTDAATSRIAGEARPPDGSHSVTNDATALPPHVLGGEEAGP